MVKRLPCSAAENTKRLLVRDRISVFGLQVTPKPVEGFL